MSYGLFSATDLYAGISQLEKPTSVLVRIASKE